MEVGCRGRNCTSIRAFKGRSPTIRRPGISGPSSKHKAWNLWCVILRAVACYGVSSLEQAVHDLRRILEWREPGFGDNATTINNIADRDRGHATRLRSRRLPPAGTAIPICYVIDGRGVSGS